MKKIIKLAIALIPILGLSMGGSLFLFSTVAAMENCASTDSEVNVSIPCISYAGQKYQVQLDATSDQQAEFPLCWTLNPQILSLGNAAGSESEIDSNNCATADSGLILQLSCVQFEQSQYEVQLLSVSETDSSPCQWRLGQVSLLAEDSNVVNSSEPVLYIVSMMHAEDVIRFDQNEAIFRDFASGLRQVSELLSSHGAKLDFGPDWTFLGGVLNYDEQLITEILAAGHGVHTHAHETSFDEFGNLYDLSVVNQLLNQAGGNGNRIANGGFVQSGPNESNWVGYVSHFKDSQGGQLFDMIIGYKDPQTQVPDSLGYVIKPNTTQVDWQVEDPHGSILYAGSNMPPFEKAGALDFSTIRSWMDKRLVELQPNKINTLYWHDTLHNYGTQEQTTARLAEWESFLSEYLDPKVSSGQIVWKTFSEMVELYQNN